MRKIEPSAGAPTKIGTLAVAQREQPLGHPVRLILRGVVAPQSPAHLGARHAGLELLLRETRGDEVVLSEQEVLVEADVGDPDRPLVAQGAVVAEDRHLVERMLLGVVE